MKKLYTKTFKTKSHMMNYFKKVQESEEIESCWCGLNAKTGWTI